MTTGHMTREDYQNRLSEIGSAIVCDLTLTYDMGFEFTVLTGTGAYTDSGNLACWPCSGHKVTDELRNLQERLRNGFHISDQELLENDFFKDACTFCNPMEGSRLIDGEKLGKTLCALRTELAGLDLPGDVFYSYVRLEDWEDDAFLFATKDELRKLFLEDYGDRVIPYSDMTDSEVEHAYRLAEEDGWDAVPVFSSSGETGFPTVADVPDCQYLIPK